MEDISELWQQNISRLLKAWDLNYNTDICNTRFMNGQHVIALITGGCRGLGLEIALALNRRFKNIVIILVDIVDPPPSISKSYNNLIFHRCDITDTFQIFLLRKKILLDFGRIHILVNNAAVTSIKPLLKMSESEIQNLLTVNLIAAHHMIVIFLPDMKYNYQGCIVNIASVLGELTPSRLIVYGASKAGLIQMHNSLGHKIKEFNSSYAVKGNTGLKAILVCPGKISTTMFEDVQTPSKILAPDLNPEVLAECIVKNICHNLTICIREPYYSKLIPLFKELDQFFVNTLKIWSGMNDVTHI
ncbi:Uncharacterized protein RNJ44_02021 [Nakaseomyces bracarensis]|uniref:Uncharacterized protein n=1 Tax=Nakaseomyces bracarensis TaxID=273131 RepID=A0ABR4NM89_9SACH